MKKQDIGVVVHYPQTLYGWHCLVRHAVAVWELIEQDKAGTLEGPLSARLQLLDAGQEEEALERYMKKHPPMAWNNSPERQAVYNK